MYMFAGSEHSWTARLDHLICETPDIEDSYARLLAAGFPSAWPIGRFWPGRRTAGVALGGLNLELAQPDIDAPPRAVITTLAFEPVSLEAAVAALRSRGLQVTIEEKWERDPGLLRERGFPEEEAQRPQLICRNAYPEGTLPIRFFFCAYGDRLRERLAPANFPSLAPVAGITLATPSPATDWRALDSWFGLPARNLNVELSLREESRPNGAVVEIRSDRGPIAFADWDVDFRFA